MMRSAPATKSYAGCRRFVRFSITEVEGQIPAMRFAGARNRPLMQTALDFQQVPELFGSEGDGLWTDSAHSPREAIATDGSQVFAQKITADFEPTLWGHYRNVCRDSAISRCYGYHHHYL